MSEEEKKEQALLRQEYVASVKANLRNQLNNIDMMNADGSVENLGENMDQKQELRKRMKEKRDRISPQERRQKSAKSVSGCCRHRVCQISENSGLCRD